jgi:hypothetical protein
MLQHQEENKLMIVRQNGKVTLFFKFLNNQLYNQDGTSEFNI